MQKETKHMALKTPQTIVYFKNGIGNLILHTPAIQALASMDPSGRVDYCVDSNWKDARMTGVMDILRNWKIVNKVFRYPRENISGKYKVWFYTMHNEGSQAWDMFRKNGKMIPEVKNLWKTNVEHERDYYMRIVRKMGYTGPTPPQYVPVKNSFEINKRGKKLVGLCNGRFHTQTWDKKEWPYFRQLAKTMRKYYDVEIVKTGIQKELADIKTLPEYDFVDKLTLSETAAVIKQLDLLVTTDTSSMHIADAVGTPNISLFGSTFVFKSGPINPDCSRVIVSDVKCRPCQSETRFRECKTFDCMKNIEVGDVISEIRRWGILS